MPLGNFSALRSAFSNRNYAIYIGGNGFSLIGFWMQRLAVSWLAWEITESAFWVGAVAFAEIGPMIVVGPLVGVWADRFDRKRLAVLIQCLMFLQAFVLFLVIISGLLNKELLFALTLAEGVIQAAYQPVRLSLIPSLVPKKDLISAAAFTAVTFNVARFVGPAIGGLVMALTSPAWAILANALSYLLIIVAWKFIEIPPRSGAPLVKQSLGKDIMEGMRYVHSRPALFGMFVLLSLIALFARPLSYMLSAFVGAVFGGGPLTLAMFTAAAGMGAVLAGLKLSMDGHAKGLVRKILLSALFTLFSIVWFVSTDNIYLGAALIFCFGYCITACSVGSQTLVQNSIDDDMRGRVLSLWVAFTRGAPAVGVLVIGWLANKYGLMWPNIIAAILCLLAILPLVKQRQEMRRYFEQ